jgi:hypothetical protein
VQKLTPEDLKDVLSRLQEAGLDAILVGGQAVNLWAYHYSADNPDLLAWIPFSSEDLDFFGGRVEVMLCHEVLGGQVALNKDFDPSPNAGVVLVNRSDRQLRIDVLASVYGLNDSEISNTAKTFVGLDKLSGVSVKVLHPVLCLEGKLRCLRGLPQNGRQDLKHVQISLLVVKQVLKETCQDTDPRPGLKMLERILGGIGREDGLYAWYRHQVYLERAIPLDWIQALHLEQWKGFMSIRLPQVLRLVQEKREKYLKLMSRLEAAQTAKPLELLHPDISLEALYDP